MQGVEVNVDRGVITTGELNELCRDIPADAPRAAIWTRVLDLLVRYHTGRVQVIVRFPDTLEVVADNRDVAGSGAVLRDREVLTECFRDGQGLFLPSAQAGEGTGMVALVPLRERGEVTAVLRVDHQKPLTAGVVENLKLLAFSISGCLTERAWVLETRLGTELMARLASIDDLASGAAAALSTIVPIMGATGGLLLEPRAGNLVILADYGEHAIARRTALPDTMSYASGLAREVFKTGEARFIRNYSDHPDSMPDLPTDPVVLLMPLFHRGTTRKILRLTFSEDSVPYNSDLSVIQAAGRVLAGLLDGLRERYAQDRLAGLLAATHAKPESELYEPLLEAALDSVPGAERGVLLVRDNPGDDFSYRATAGYDLEVLRELRMSEERVRGWYAATTGIWGQATPIIRQASTANLTRRAWLAGITPSTDRQRKLKAMKTNLCIPVLEDGWVRAVVNLDNTVREDAFALDSIRVAHQVAMVAATVLRAARDRAALEAAALTDSVTGLLNRRGLEAELKRTLARALRDEEPLSVLMLDMTDFKGINDALGHAVGDEALRLVAQALQGNTRGGDVFARWGGDEFVAILPRQGASDAQHTINRLIQVISSINMEGHLLAVNIGSATFPADASSSEELLHIADARMYQQKHSESQRQ